MGGTNVVTITHRATCHPSFLLSPTCDTTVIPPDEVGRDPHQTTMTQEDGTSNKPPRRSRTRPPTKHTNANDRDLHHHPTPFTISSTTRFTCSAHGIGFSQKPSSTTNSFHSGLRPLMRASFSSLLIFFIIFSRLMAEVISGNSSK